VPEKPRLRLKELKEKRRIGKYLIDGKRIKRLVELSE
jgi:hypothetical protein